MAETPVEPLDENVDELLPFDEFPPTEEEVEEEFADESLFDPEPVIVEEDEPPPIGKSWAFDFIGGGFYPGPGGGPQTVHGLTTLRFWVEKCLRTERGSYPIYDDDFGIEGVNDLLGGPISETDVADLGSKIHDALIFHPNITDVVGFKAFWDESDEVLLVSFAVMTDQGEEVGFDDLSVGIAA